VGEGLGADVAVGEGLGADVAVGEGLGVTGLVVGDDDPDGALEVVLVLEVILAKT
jgi:hypothetical protein